jgi:hypothetical protein
VILPDQFQDLGAKPMRGFIHEDDPSINTSSLVPRLCLGTRGFSHSAVVEAQSSFA